LPPAGAVVGGGDLFGFSVGIGSGRTKGTSFMDITKVSNIEYCTTCIEDVF